MAEDRGEEKPTSDSYTKETCNKVNKNTSEGQNSRKAHVKISIFRYLLFI